MSVAPDSPIRTWIFDCDGVILDSNRIKTEAFRNVALPYGREATQELVDFHVARGGISRVEKFKHFVSEILQRPGDDQLVSELCGSFAETVSRCLASASVAPGLSELRFRTQPASWMVISGGVQSEIEACFRTKGIENLFDGGIHGNPATKYELFNQLIESGVISFPAIFLGDSQYDFEVASSFGVDFRFIYGWTDMCEWQSFCENADVAAHENVEDALNSLLHTEV